MLKELKERVLAANQQLPVKGLVTYTWGNVSGIDREKGLVVIKPSGIPYCNLTIDKLVVVDLAGNKVAGELDPSSDTATHLVLYRNFPQIGGVVHTHSEWAVSWAQAGRDIPALGTTHADHFYGRVPCTRKLERKEVEQEYEKNTGEVIVETLENKDPIAIPGVIVHQHGPFTWGKEINDAVYNAVVLEEIAKMAYRTTNLSSGILPIDDYLLNKHYKRKHGEDAYYGQTGKEEK